MVAKSSNSENPPQHQGSDDPVQTARLSGLHRPALVLNRNWQAIGVATVARSLILLWNDKARVVDPADYQQYTWEDWSRMKPRDGEPFIRSVSTRLRVPEVITLTSYEGLPKRKVSFTRRNLFRRDRFTCQYCGRRPGSDALTIDHVWPRSRGGVSSWENCVLACLSCNHRKADRTPEQANMKLQKEPVRPIWKPMYAAHDVRIDSWARFVSDAYWEVDLQA